MKEKNLPPEKIANPVIVAQSQAVTDLKPNLAGHDEIARKAYFIFLKNGCQHGHHLEHWLEAEARLRAERQQGELLPEGVT